MKLVPLSLSAALLFAGCSRHSSEAVASRSADLPPVRVQAAEVNLVGFTPVTEITGVVRPAQRAQLAAKVMGSITEMPVSLGQQVRAGDVLVKIAAGEIAARVVQARSQLNAARRDLERERDLLKKGASTADMVRGLEDRFVATEAMVREAETMQAYTELRAPFDGVVSRKLANAGDLASPGLPLLEVEGTANFQVEAGVPDSLAAQLKPGATLRVEIPATGTRFEGRLAEISSAADPMALTVFVKIAVPADAVVRSGQFARVQVPAAPGQALLVPTSAVTRSGQMQRVFVVGESKRAVLRLVKTGSEQNGSVEILAGLDAKERVVVAPPSGLREGQPLEIVP